MGGATILLDQISKLYIQQHFRLNESVVVIQRFFSLTYIRNPGAAFGLFADKTDGFRAIFFLIISIVALSLLIFFFRQLPKEDLWALISISLLFYN